MNTETESLWTMDFPDVQTVECRPNLKAGWVLLSARFTRAEEHSLRRFLNGAKQDLQPGQELCLQRDATDLWRCVWLKRPVPPLRITSGCPPSVRGCTPYVSTRSRALQT